MRILHVLDHSLPLHSGYSFRTLAILREQRALGWETIQLTSVKHTVAAAREEEASGFTFHRTLPGSSRLERAPGLYPLGVVSGLAQRLADVVRETRPQILHAHSPCLNA